MNSELVNGWKEIVMTYVMILHPDEGTEYNNEKFFRMFCNPAEIGIGYLNKSQEPSVNHPFGQELANHLVQ
jgi:hypothetical protein